MPSGPWSYADLDEMMKEMEKEFMNFRDVDQLPKHLAREATAEEDGSVRKKVGPIVYGYSVTIGPDGKADVREFGTVKPGQDGGWHTTASDSREPLTDIIEDEREVRIIAELPGVKRKDDIELTSDGQTLVYPRRDAEQEILQGAPRPELS